MVHTGEVKRLSSVVDVDTLVDSADVCTTGSVVVLGVDMISGF